MADLQTLMAQRAELDRKIAEAQRGARAEAIAQVKSIMAENGLTMADIAGRATRSPDAAPKRAATGKVAPKYRNAATGETWTGRGLKPKWLQAAIDGGAKLNDYLIE